MLGIHGIGRDRADYYLSDLARELPASGPASWAGRAAEGLGLTGPVRADEFGRLLQSRHPRHGAVLGSGRVSVPAFDLTFERAEVGQRALRTGRCRRRAPGRGRPQRGRCGVALVSGAARHHRHPARGAGAASCCPPVVPSRPCSRTGSAGTVTRTSTAMSCWRTSCTVRTGAGVPVTGGGSPPIARPPPRSTRRICAPGCAPPSASGGPAVPGAPPRWPASGPSCSVPSRAAGPTSAATCTKPARTRAAAPASPGRPPVRPRHPARPSPTSRPSGGSGPRTSAAAWSSSRGGRGWDGPCSTSTASPG